jgi:hypothetical protein
MTALRSDVPWIRTVAAVCALYSSGGGAVPPPPVPTGRIEAANNIATVATVLQGAWRGTEGGPGNHPMELRVGQFGNSANYLLIGRIVHIPQGQTGARDLQISYLSVLTYSVRCHAFQMISLDRLGNTQHASNDCTETFPIARHANGSLDFEYVDASGRRVRVHVKDRGWREARIQDGNGSVGRESGFIATKVADHVTWGISP